MKRYTFRGKNGMAFFNFCSINPMSQYDISKSKEAVERLAAYEDTGLLPKEILQLKKFRGKQLSNTNKD